jgi:hypothetical protein
MVDSNSDRTQDESPVLNYVSFVNAFEKWLAGIVAKYNGDPKLVISHAKETFESSLISNMRYHLATQKSLSSDPAKAAYHGLMSELYQSFLTHNMDYQLLVENNSILKTKRQMIEEIRQFLIR